MLDVIPCKLFSTSLNYNCCRIIEIMHMFHLSPQTTVAKFIEVQKLVFRNSVKEFKLKMLDTIADQQSPDFLVTILRLLP